jgi:hypothetical protein
MVEGQNQTARNSTATEYEGATVHLMSTAVGDNATSTEVSNNSGASASTAAGDWSISHDNTNGTTTLTNSADIDFGSPSGFVIKQIVIQSPNNSDKFLIDNSPSGDTDLSGDGTTTINSGDLVYTFGGE